MKKKIASGLLALVLILSVCSLPAFAAERGGLLIAPNPTISANPMAEVTREAVVDRLWELSGKPAVDFLVDYTDVEAESDALRWAASEKLASGYGDGTFGPDKAVTRAELYTMIYRYVQHFDLGFRGAWMFHLSCADLSEVPEWAFEPTFWMVASRLIDGDVEYLYPAKTVTVGEADDIFEGLADQFAEKELNFADYGRVQ